MLKTIQRGTSGQITIEKLPTVADLRARRVELTRAALHEALLEEEDDRETFRVVVESLAEEFDIMEIALAAVKLAHEASGAVTEEEEIPEPVLRPSGASVEDDVADRDAASNAVEGPPTA